MDIGIPFVVSSVPNIFFANRNPCPTFIWELQYCPGLQTLNCLAHVVLLDRILLFFEARVIVLIHELLAAARLGAVVGGGTLNPKA